MTHEPEHFYDAQLAAIHDEFYTGLARAAASTLVEVLRESEITSGLIIDLGCGSGAAAPIFINAGYDVFGIDVSPAMIDMAEAACPEGTFRCESIYDADLPDCVAVVAFGEIFNYTNDGDPSAELAALLLRIHDALEAGGMLLFDVANPGRSQTTPAVQKRQLNGNTMTVVATENDSTLRREITVTGDISSAEVHHLHLWNVGEIEALLHVAEFENVKQANYRNLNENVGWDSQYEGLEANSGWTIWLAR